LQSFTALRISGTQAQSGSLAWELRGTPRLDDQGRFDGYIGMARPLDTVEASQTAAAALRPALQSHGAAALLAVKSGSAWRVQQFNDAAARLWPQLQATGNLHDAALPLPAAVLAALDSETPAELDGWRLAPFGPLADGTRGLVLAQAAAADAGHSEESDNFSFTVSHDLRAPIRVVEGFTRIVKEDYGRLLDRVGNDHLDRVLGAAARMNLMIDALLTLARLSSQPLARQPVNLTQLAGYVMDDLRRATPEREAEVEIEPGLHTQGDPTLLRLVLENLLGNAWKYSARCPRAHISLAVVQHGGRPAYVVRDNGAGFDMRSAERLFGLFQRLHSASEFPGHGVGLASVRRIVRRHGGDIWAEAELGRGAAFYFTLAS
jgi:signal transduction histidine kinase